MASQVLVQVNREAEKVLRNLGHVNSREMIDARRAVARSWRRVLGVRGGGVPVSSRKSRKVRVVGGTPSAPGEPPRKQSGSLARSVRAGVVGDQGRVAVQWFTGLLLEGGVNATLSSRSRKAKRRLVIVARPSAQRAIDAVQDELGDIMARVMEDRLARA